MLQSLNLRSPAFRGINENTAVSEEGWATVARNCVIDNNGRLAARKGWTAETAVAISGTPSIEQIFEYIDSTGTSTIISCANSKIYSGTTSLVDITGSLTVTDDNWKFSNINGNVVGFQSGHAPIIWKGSGSATTLQQEITDWAASTAYAVGDLVVATSAANPTLYFHCTTAGTSGSSEPTWDTTDGNTTADGSVTWTTRTIPVGDTVISAFGRIWTTDSTQTVLKYSDLLIPQNFHGGSAGSIDLKSVWVYGMDQVQAIEEFNGFLIIFGKKHIIVYQGADDPTFMSIADTVNGTGCVARDSVQNIGTDILFLSDFGVRSFSRTIQEKSMPISSVSKNIRNTLVTNLASETNNLIRSVFHEKDGFYVLTFPTVGVDYVFDVRGQMPDGTYRVTTWSDINPKALCSATDGTLYMGQAGVIGSYSGYLDNTTAYALLYKSAWNNFDSQNLKFLKKARAKISNGNAYVVSVQAYYDYSSTPYTTQVTVTSQTTPAEYGIAEWGIFEFSGGSEESELLAQMKGNGRFVQIGFSLTINNVGISFQNVELYLVGGRKG